MGDSDILNYQPGQTVTFYKEVKNANGQRTDDGYIPVITRVVYPGFIAAAGFPQNMSRIDVGLYFFQLVIPQGAGAVGTYLVDIVSLDPNTLLLVNDSRQIVVTAPYGNYSTSTVGSGGPSGLPGPPGPMGPQGPPGPYGTAGGDLSGTYPNPKVISIQGHAVSSTTPTDGYVLTWSATDGYWQAAPDFPITVSNVASLTSISAANGHAAFVQSVLAPWYFVTNGSTLTIDHITIEATANGGNTRWVRDTDYHHSVWQAGISHWYIDPINGNDENQGGYSATQSSPASLKTFAEYIRRVGKNSSFSTVLGISSINIHWLNDQPNNSDPVDLYNSFHNVSLYMDGALIQVGSGTFGSVTNINRAGNIQTTAFNADGYAPLNYWTQFLGMLVHDTTNDTWFCVDRDLGNRQAQFTCPYVGAASGIAFTMVPGTITTGHSYVIYRFPKVYAGIFAPPVYGEYFVNGTPTALAQFTHLHFASAGGSPGAIGMGATFQFNSAAYGVIQECTFEGQSFISGSIWEQTIVYNCFFLNGFTGREILALGGGSNGQVNLSFDSTLDGDIIIHSDLEIQGNVAFGTVYFNDDRGPSHQYLDIPLWGSFGSAPDGGTVVIMPASFGGPGAIWGPTTLRIKSNGRLYLTGTAAQNILFTGSILIDGLATGAKVAPGSPRRLTDGIAITPANIDSTVGGWSSGIVSSFSDSCGIFSYIPTSGSMPLNFVYIDPVNGSDTNQGGYTTAQGSPAALKTWAEFERRVGPSKNLTLGFGPVITYLTGYTTATAAALDPIRWTPFMQRASWQLNGTKTLVTSGTMGVGTAVRNTGTGTPTHIDLSAYPSATVGQLVQNTTAGKLSMGILSASLGSGIFEVYQPLTPAPAGTISSYGFSVAEFNTWAPGDTFSLWSLPMVCVAEVSAVGGQYIPPNFPCSTMRWLHLVSPDGQSDANTLIGGNVTMAECVSDAEIMDTSSDGGLRTIIWGCSFADVQGGSNSFARYMFGGGITSAFGTNCSWAPSLGAQMGGSQEVHLTVARAFDGGQLGDVLIRTNLILDGNWPCQFGGVGGDAMLIWGSSMLDLIGTSRLVLPSGAGAAVAAIKCSGGIRLNNQTVANAINPVTGAWSGQISLTPANIDLAFASGGFGGYAINPCGACITKQAST